MKTQLLLLFCLICSVCSQFLDREPPIDLSNEESLKSLLDNIDKMRREKNDFLSNIPDSSNIPDTSKIPSFPTDELCTLSSEEECVKICSNRDLCVQCFKSHLEGLGYKCLVLNP